jgi:hypothetical protein
MVFHDLGVGNGFRVTAYQRVHKTTDPWANPAMTWFQMFDPPQYQDVPEVAMDKTNVKPFVFVGNWEFGAGGGTISWGNVVAVQGAPTEVWVDDDWAGSYEGEVVDGHVFGYDAFATIQDGIDAVAASTVHVAAGNYSESVTIAPGAELAVQGAGRDVANWIAPADHASRMHCLKCALSGYTAGDTTLDISGFTFSVEDNAISNSGIGILVNSATQAALYLSIHDNKFIETTTIANETANSMLLCHNRFAARDPSGEAPVKIYDNLDYTTGGICMSNARAFDIYNNTFDGGSDALYIGYGCPTSTTIGDHHICNNAFKNASNAATPGGPWPSVYVLYHGSGTGMTFLPNLIECNTFEENDMAIGYSMDSDVTYPDDVVCFNNFSNNDEAINVTGDHARTLDAEHNWWGDASGPSGQGPGTGDPVSSNVDYTPWLGAELVGCQCGSVTDGTLDAKEQADTEVVVDGTANVTAAEYCSNPEADLWCEFGKYIDVSIDDDANVTEIEIRLYYTDAEIEGLGESSLRLYWWDGYSWVECSNTGVNTADVGPYSGYIWAIVDATSTPNLSQLQGTPFGGCGSPPPVPKVPASPTLPVSVVAFAAGVVALFALRRTVASQKR